MAKRGRKPRVVKPPKASVRLDKTLLEGVNGILQERGTTVQAYLELQLVRFVRTKALHGLDDVLTFGQYQGAVVREVCQADLAYMHWLVIEQRSKKFKADVFEFVANLASSEGTFDFARTRDLDF